MRSSKLLTFDPDPNSAKNYLLVADKSIKWSLLYTEAYSLKFKKKCHIKFVGMEGKQVKLASIKDMIFVALGNRITVYRLKYQVLEDSKEYTLDFEDVFYKVQVIELDLNGNSITDLKIFERNDKLHLAFFVDFEMYVYTSMSKVLREADLEKEKLLTHLDSKADMLGSFKKYHPHYIGEPMLYSKFSPSFRTVVGGTILDIDLPDEKYFNQNLLKVTQNETENNL